MVQSVEELISLNVVSTLQGIADEAGYGADVGVQRARRLGNDINSTTFTLVDGDLRYHDQQSLGRDRWIKVYTIVCPIMDAQNASVDHGTASNRVRADVYKAVMVDVYRGGYALDTRFASARSTMDAEAPYETVEIEVHFYTNKDDPYSRDDIT